MYARWRDNALVRVVIGNEREDGPPLHPWWPGARAKAPGLGAADRPPKASQSAHRACVRAVGVPLRGSRNNRHPRTLGAHEIQALLT